MQMAVILPLSILELLALEKAIPRNTIHAIPIISIMTMCSYQVRAAR